MKKRLMAICVFFAMTSNFSVLAQESDSQLQEDDSFEDEFGDEFGDEFDDFYGSDEFISISTGTQKAISKAPSVAAVITSENIRKLGANTVHEVIESVTGIHVYPSNLNRMVPNYSIRGIHTQDNPQVLVLVNGIRTTQNYNGAKWHLFNTGVEIIDRIEVIKGPGSARARSRTLFNQLST